MSTVGPLLHRLGNWHILIPADAKLMAEKPQRTSQTQLLVTSESCSAELRSHVVFSHLRRSPGCEWKHFLMLQRTHYLWRVECDLQVSKCGPHPAEVPGTDPP